MVSLLDWEPFGMLSSRWLELIEEIFSMKIFKNQSCFDIAYSLKVRGLFISSPRSSKQFYSLSKIHQLYEQSRLAYGILKKHRNKETAVDDIEDRYEEEWWETRKNEES